MRDSTSILIVDDAPFMRKMVKSILKKNGYGEVLEANSAETGLEKYELHKPDITLMDINLASEDGIAVVEKIKKTDADAKIIMLSALNSPQYVAKSLIAGAVDFLIKPFQADNLVEFIDKNLSENIEFDIEKIKEWENKLQNSDKKHEELSQHQINILIDRFIK